MPTYRSKHDGHVVTVDAGSPSDVQMERDQLWERIDTTPPPAPGKNKPGKG